MVVVVIGPEGTRWENDDFEGSLHRSHLEFQAVRSGEHTIVITSAAVGETGKFVLDWDLDDP